MAFILAGEINSFWGEIQLLYYTMFKLWKGKWLSLAVSFSFLNFASEILVESGNHSNIRDFSTGDKLCVQCFSLRLERQYQTMELTRFTLGNGTWRVDMRKWGKYRKYKKKTEFYWWILQMIYLHHIAQWANKWTQDQKKYFSKTPANRLKTPARTSCPWKRGPNPLQTTTG